MPSPSEMEQTDKDTDSALLSFSELGLPASVQRAIDELEFTTCTAVQSQALPYSLSQHDVCAQANTGTGKTAAFLTTILSQHIEFPLDQVNPDWFASCVSPRTYA